MPIQGNGLLDKIKYGLRNFFNMRRRDYNNDYYNSYVDWTHNMRRPNAYEDTRGVIFPYSQRDPTEWTEDQRQDWIKDLMAAYYEHPAATREQIINDTAERQFENPRRRPQQLIRPERETSFRSSMSPEYYNELYGHVNNTDRPSSPSLKERFKTGINNLRNRFNDWRNRSKKEDLSPLGQEEITADSENHSIFNGMVDYPQQQQPTEIDFGYGPPRSGGYGPQQPTPPSEDTNPGTKSSPRVRMPVKRVPDLPNIPNIPNIKRSPSVGSLTGLSHESFDSNFSTKDDIPGPAISGISAPNRSMYSSSSDDEPIDSISVDWGGPEEEEEEPVKPVPAFPTGNSPQVPQGPPIVLHRKPMPEVVGNTDIVDDEPNEDGSYDVDIRGSGLPNPNVSSTIQDPDGTTHFYAPRSQIAPAKEPQTVGSMAGSQLTYEPPAPLRPATGARAKKEATFTGFDEPPQRPSPSYSDFPSAPSMPNPVEPQQAPKSAFEPYTSKLGQKKAAMDMLRQERDHHYGAIARQQGIPQLDREVMGERAEVSGRNFGVNNDGTPFVQAPDVNQRAAVPKRRNRQAIDSSFYIQQPPQPVHAKAPPPQVQNPAVGSLAGAGEPVQTRPVAHPKPAAPVGVMAVSQPAAALPVEPTIEELEAAVPKDPALWPRAAVDPGLEARGGLPPGVAPTDLSQRHYSRYILPTDSDVDEDKQKQRGIMRRFEEQGSRYEGGVYTSPPGGFGGPPKPRVPGPRVSITEPHGATFTRTFSTAPVGNMFDPDYENEMATYDEYFKVKKRDERGKEIAAKKNRISRYSYDDWMNNPETSDLVLHHRPNIAQAVRNNPEFERFLGNEHVPIFPPNYRVGRLAQHKTAFSRNSVQPHINSIRVWRSMLPQDKIKHLTDLKKYGRPIVSAFDPVTIK
jgi:hypothetical protein